MSEEFNASEFRLKQIRMGERARAETDLLKQGYIKPLPKTKSSRIVVKERKLPKQSRLAKFANTKLVSRPLLKKAKRLAIKVHISNLLYGGQNYK